MRMRSLPFLRGFACIALFCALQSCAVTSSPPGDAAGEAFPDEEVNENALAISAPPATVKGVSPVGKEYYTAANIWYKNPRVIWSLNHHGGAILPAGTKVTIKGLSRRSIGFIDEKGTKYRLMVARKYTAPGFTSRDLFEQYFTPNDPMQKGGEFESLTDMEKNAVKTGRIAVGMSKKAVLMAYGYPPSHMTPSTESDVWKYWQHKFRAYLVYFQEGRVIEIKGDL